MRESSPVFYLEPEDWTEIEDASEKLSPCGCNKSHSTHTLMLEALPEESSARCFKNTTTASKRAFRTVSESGIFELTSIFQRFKLSAQMAIQFSKPAND